MMNISLRKIRENWLQKLFYFVLASPVIFLLVNKYPYFLVVTVLVIVILGFGFFLYKRKITSHHYPVLLALVLIYAYLIFSYFFSGQYFSDFFSYSFLRTDGNFFFCYILFFTLAVPFFDYRKLIDYYFKLIFFVFSVFALIGIIELITGYSSYMLQGSTDRGMMFMGLNMAHNATGSVYALVSIFALIFLLEEKAKKIKFIYSLIFLLCITGLYLAKSMGSYIAFAAAAVLVLWMYFKSARKFFITISILAVGSIPVLWFTHIFERLLKIFQLKGTAGERAHLWEKAWDLFSKSPLVGIGFGRYNDIISVYNEKLAGRYGTLAVFLHPRFYYGFDHAHNSYLQFLAETGIMGLGLLIFFWCLCFYIIYKALNSCKDRQSRMSFMAGLATVVVLFFLSLTENYFSATTVMIPSSMIVSLCIGLAWQEKTKQKLTYTGGDNG
jgi:O-antigen ligase